MRHSYYSPRIGAFALSLIALAAPAVTHAQDTAPEAGPPERGVARMSIVNGEVSVRRGDSGDWVAAAVNAPLMVEDRVSTGAGSRAEVQFDSANLIRVGANAEIRLAQIDYGRYNIQVAHGTVSFRVLRESQAQVEMDTPTVSVRPLSVGAYRIYVKEDGQTEITVRLGEAEIVTPKGSERLQAGQTMLARGDKGDPEFRIVPGIARDEWDRWNEQRDREMLNSSSYRNVPQDVYGAEDLDNSGRWVNDPSYGEVWAPNVDPDWAPYQNGRWVWEDYYGWTWVSYDPWGWAPFHYGRWFYGAGGWCWYPGGFGRHYWAPGLVAFFGFGPGSGVGFGFGSVGWVALAPYERMYPWWGRGVYAGYRNPAYLSRSVSVTNVNITNVYRNARVTRAIGSVSAVDFRQGRFGNITRASGAQIREAGLVRGQLPVAPTAASLRYSNRTVVNAPRSSENVRFFSRNAPAPVQRVPFAEQQRTVQQLSRQPAAAARNSVGPANSGAWRSASTPATPAPASRGEWRPVSPPVGAAPGGAARGNDAQQRNAGWQRFGEPRSGGATPVSRGGSWNTPRPSTAQPNAVQYRPPGGSVPPGAQQSIRVAPQVVREKSAPKAAPRSESGSHATHSSGGSGGGSHGGSHR